MNEIESVEKKKNLTQKDEEQIFSSLEIQWGSKIPDAQLLKMSDYETFTFLNFECSDF